MTDRVEIYTDGACSGNPGPGGWAAILKARGVEKEISGFEQSTTNNRMELTAAIKALQCLNRPCRVRLYSDSAYLVSAFNQGWLANWQRNGWRNAAGDPVSNPDLWQSLLTAAQGHRIEWIKVKGHADNVLNNRCDQLAVAEIRKNRAAEAVDASLSNGLEGEE
jgi:ribonuclease HI